MSLILGDTRISATYLHVAQINKKIIKGESDQVFLSGQPGYGDRNTCTHVHCVVPLTFL